jgi:DNA invertase Pin-like site-specific DNA recombinase
MIIGYARISTEYQSTDMQLNALKQANCEVIYSDIASSMKIRIELNNCLKAINENDTLVVYKLDRLGRSVREVVNVLYELEQKNVNIISLSDHLDGTNPQGRLMLNILLSFSQFERELTVQRVKQGLKAAIDRGSTLGRPKLLNKKQAKLAFKMRYEQHLTVNWICKELKISRPTYYRYIAMFK